MNKKWASCEGKPNEEHKLQNVQLRGFFRFSFADIFLIDWQIMKVGWLALVRHTVGFTPNPPQSFKIPSVRQLNPQRDVPARRSVLNNNAVGSSKLQDLFDSPGWSFHYRWAGWHFTEGLESQTEKEPFFRRHPRKIYVFFPPSRRQVGRRDVSRALIRECHERRGFPRPNFPEKNTRPALCPQ